jgi:hypothetical protein
LKPEWWGSPLAQGEKYQGRKKTFDKITTMIIILEEFVTGMNPYLAKDLDMLSRTYFNIIMYLFLSCMNTIAAFWDIVSCRRVEVERRFRGRHCFRLQDNDDGGSIHV